MTTMSVGCGDFIFGTTDKGLLRVSLVTEYEVVEDGIRDATIVSGHEQYLNIGITSRGREEIMDPSSLTYSVTPSDGVEIEAIAEADSDNPPDIHITVTKPGEYRLDAQSAGVDVDGIDLMFDESTSLELSVRVRSPWEDNFAEQQTGEPSTVQEGSHATFLPIPLDVDGERLAGDIETRVSVDPDWAVVPGVSLGGVYEQGVWTLSGEIEFYFIDPAEVTVTVTDTVSEASGEHVFTVEPIQIPEP